MTNVSIILIRYRMSAAIHICQKMYSLSSRPLVLKFLAAEIDRDLGAPPQLMLGLAKECGKNVDSVKHPPSSSYLLQLSILAEQ